MPFLATTAQTIRESGEKADSKNSWCLSGQARSGLSLTDMRHHIKILCTVVLFVNQFRRAHSTSYVPRLNRPIQVLRAESMQARLRQCLWREAGAPAFDVAHPNRHQPALAADAPAHGCAARLCAVAAGPRQQGLAAH